MIALAYYLLKVILCSGLLFLYYHVALRNKLFHQWNRFYLLATIVLSLTIPCLQFNVWSTEKSGDTIQLLQAVYSADEYVAEINTAGPKLSIEQWYAIAYGTISIVVLMLFILALLRIRSIIRSHSVMLIDDIKFITTEEKDSPFSFFNYIFWNKQIELNSSSGKHIFQHELVHVREKHSFDKIFLQLVLIVCWCNPFFWLIRKELRMIHEFIADKKAVGQADASAFAAMILRAAYPQHSFNNISNQFFQSSIKRRLAMLTKQKKSTISYAGRILVLPLIAFLAFAFTIKAKDVKTNDSVLMERYHAIENTGDTKVEDDGLSNVPNQFSAVKTTRPQKKDTTDNPLVYIDGVKKGKLKELGGLDKLAPLNQVKAMFVYKGKEAIDKYGMNGTDGVIELITKNAPPPPPPPKGTIIKTSGDANPLVFIEGKEKGRLKDGIMEELSPNEIESINVLKGEAAEKIYGEKGKQGVIEIKLKKSQEEKENESGSAAQGNPILEKVEIEAQFPGGVNAWRSFLGENLNAQVPSKNKAPNGSYTVIASFVVYENGTISDIKTTTNFGYGMEDEVIRTIKRSPKWLPAIQNGKVVTSRRLQPITFVVPKS